MEATKQIKEESKVKTVLVSTFVSIKLALVGSKDKEAKEKHDESRPFCIVTEMFDLD